MLLKGVAVENYRCFGHLSEFPFEPLTAFIGPNDAGKTSLLRLLRHGLRNEPIPAPDFRDAGRPIVLVFRFDVTRAPEAEATEAFRRSERELIVKKEFAPGQRPATFAFCRCYVDDRLNRLGELRTSELTELMAELGVEERPTNNPGRIEAIKRRAEANPPAEHESWVRAGADLDAALPDYLLFGADEDLTLSSGPLVAALRQVYRRFLERRAGEIQELLEGATVDLQEALGGLGPVLASFASDGLSLEVEPSLDISNGLQLGELRVRSADGTVVGFGGCGDGTKRRIMVAVFTWANNVLGRIVEEEGRSMLWGFDEPDTHLHYEAQYRLLAQLKGMARGHMQILLCTHSIPIIDRLPATAIRHVVRSGDGRQSTVEYLDDSPVEGGDVAEFLRSVGSGVGFANSLLFYERCFLLVEGPTEEKALPILYRKLHGVELIDDGIRLFAAENDGMALNLARLLHAQRKEVIVLLDNDTRGRLDGTVARLREAGMDVGARIVHAGDVEFEDCFPDDVIVDCLNRHHQRRDGHDWNASHLAPYRARLAMGEHVKLSREFLGAEVGPASGVGVSKPEFGRRLAEAIDGDQIPPVVRSVFDLARSLAVV